MPLRNPHNKQSAVRICIHLCAVTQSLRLLWAILNFRLRKWRLGASGSHEFGERYRRTWGMGFLPELFLFLLPIATAVTERLHPVATLSCNYTQFCSKYVISKDK